MKQTKNRWLDHYAIKARKEQYAARSVYKLEEIQKKHRLIRKGDHVLDLGCSPGSWLQYAAGQTGPQGKVVGIDLKPVTAALPPNVMVTTGDIYDIGPELTQTGRPRFNVVLSDMAPATTGSKHADGVRSFDLCRAAMSLADAVLRPGGHFVVKLFQGEDFKLFCDQMKARYERIKIFKPQSSRKASREIFIIGLGKKECGPAADLTGS